MARTGKLNQFLFDIAEAIREKDNTSDPIVALDFPQRILDIPYGIQSWNRDDNTFEEFIVADGHSIKKGDWLFTNQSTQGHVFTHGDPAQDTFRGVALTSGSSGMIIDGVAPKTEPMTIDIPDKTRIFEANKDNLAIGDILYLNTEWLVDAKSYLFVDRIMTNHSYNVDTEYPIITYSDNKKLLTWEFDTNQDVKVYLYTDENTKYTIYKSNDGSNNEWITEKNWYEMNQTLNASNWSTEIGWVTTNITSHYCTTPFTHALWIEDANIRRMAVGDILKDNTKIYFKIPQDACRNEIFGTSTTSTRVSVVTVSPYVGWWELYTQYGALQWRTPEYDSEIFAEYDSTKVSNSYDTGLIAVHSTSEDPSVITVLSSILTDYVWVDETTLRPNLYAQPIDLDEEVDIGSSSYILLDLTQESVGSHQEVQNFYSLLKSKLPLDSNIVPVLKNWNGTGSRYIGFDLSQVLGTNPNGWIDLVMMNGSTVDSSISNIIRLTNGVVDMIPALVEKLNNPEYSYMMSSTWVDEDIANWCLSHGGVLLYDAFNRGKGGN